MGGISTSDARRRRVGSSQGVASLLALAGLVLAATSAGAGGTFGGSLALTSDYFVRGISRSNGQAALQVDGHYFNDGFLAGLFASNTQIDPDDHRDVELSPFLGYVWSGRDWQGKLLLSNYSYPWNQDGSAYNYNEINIDAVYHDWLDIHADFSPDFPRYYEGALRSVDSESVSINLQHRLWRRFSGSAGAGYVQFNGLDSKGYGFWGVGLAYDVAPVSIVLSVVGTTGEARALFYNAAAGSGQVVGTVLWRF